ncbi:MAG: RNA-binding protein [Candidatus Pacearchaeota archaeon]
MKIYVGNLPFSLTEEGLKAVFSNYNVGEVLIIKNSFSGKSKGFGFVVIEDEEAARKAIEEINGKEVEGRVLKVAEAKPISETPKKRFRRGFRRNFRRRKEKEISEDSEEEN